MTYPYKILLDNKALATYQSLQGSLATLFNSECFNN